MALSRVIFILDREPNALLFVDVEAKVNLGKLLFSS